jgi:hypothetical protein
MGGQATTRPLYPWERPGANCIGGWVGPKAGVDGCGISRPTGIRSPDRPVRSESLYRHKHLCEMEPVCDENKNTFSCGSVVQGSFYLYANDSVRKYIGLQSG